MPAGMTLTAFALPAALTFTPWQQPAAALGPGPIAVLAGPQLLQSGQAPAKDASVVPCSQTSHGNTRSWSFATDCESRSLKRPKIERHAADFPAIQTDDKFMRSLAERNRVEHSFDGRSKDGQAVTRVG
jgi:hypothetical protein